MTDCVLYPLTATTAALVPIPATVPMSGRAAFLASLTHDDVADCEVVPLYGAPSEVPAPSPLPPDLSEA